MYRWLSFNLGVLTLCAAMGWAAEVELSNVRIGMTPEEVVAEMGTPTAVMVAQPAPVVRTAPEFVGGMAGTMPSPTSTSKPHLLIFIYNGQEIEIQVAPPVIQMGGEAMGMPSMPGMPPSPALPPPSSGETGTTSDGKTVRIPSWAYLVRPTKLSLDQQMLIYKINDRFSLGITLSGQGAEARVSDIVACSFAPSFTKYYGATPSRKPDPFWYPVKKISVPPNTSKMVTIGSSLADVLKAHKWPEFFFPFNTEELGKLTVGRTPRIPDVDIPPREQSAAAAGLGMTAGPAGGGAEGGDVSDKWGGKKPIKFNDGDMLLIKSPFARSCLLLYPREQIAFTLVNFKVVRIQVGLGVRKPPDPPKPTMIMPTMMPWMMPGMMPGMPGR